MLGKSNLFQHLWGKFTEVVDYQQILTNDNFNITF